MQQSETLLKCIAIYGLLNKIEESSWCSYKRRLRVSILDPVIIMTIRRDGTSQC